MAAFVKPFYILFMNVKSKLLLSLNLIHFGPLFGNGVIKWVFRGYKMGTLVRKALKLVFAIIINM